MPRSPALRRVLWIALAGAAVTGIVFLARQAAIPPVPEIPAGEIDDASLADRIERSLRAIRIDPRSAEARADLAMVCHVHELHGFAEDAYRQALRLREEPRWRWFLAELLERKGAKEEAEAEVRKVVAAAPSHEAAHRQLARLLATNGKTDEALSVARGCVERTPEDAAAHLVLAEVCAEREDWSGTETAARAAADRGGRSTIGMRAWQLLAKAYHVTGREAEALVATGRAGDGSRRVLWPDPWRLDLSQRVVSFAGLAHEAKVALLDGFYEPARETLERLRLRRPDDLVTLTDLGAAQRFTNRRAEAEATLRHAIAKHPAASEPRIQLALVVEELGRREDGLAILGDLIARQPTQSQPYEVRGMMFVRAGRLRDALGDFEAAVTRSPGLARLRIHAGYCLAELGRAADAEGHFRKAAELDPAEPDAHAGIALAALLRNDLAACDAALAESARLAPDGSLLQNIVRERRAGQ